MLKNSGYIGSLTFGGSGSLTASGLREAERLKRSQTPRRDPTPAPVAVYLTVTERADLEAFGGALDRADVESKLTGDELLEFQADLDTARGSTRSTGQPCWHTSNGTESNDDRTFAN